MGLEVSNATPQYSFYPIPAELCEVLAYHGGIQAITFS